MTIEERIEILERELVRAKHRNRKLMLAGIGLVVGIAVVGTFAGAEGKAQTQPAANVGKVIRANTFIVEDENGKTRAMLTGLNGGPGRVPYDENDKQHAEVVVFKYGPTLRLFDENGKMRAYLGVIADGVGLTLSDEKGKRSVGVCVTDFGSGLTLSDEKGKMRADVGVRKDGTAINLFDEKGKGIWGAP